MAVSKGLRFFSYIYSNCLIGFLLGHLDWLLDGWIIGSIVQWYLVGEHGGGTLCHCGYGGKQPNSGEDLRPAPQRMIFLDAAWFAFFSGTIWNFTYNENYDPFYVFSLRLAFSMQIMGFSVRILSSLLCIQMYRLGPSNGDRVSYHEAFYRRSFLSPPTEDMARQCSDNIFSSYVRIASPYTALFDDAQDKGYASEGEKQSSFCNGVLLSASEASQHASFNGKHFR